MGRRSEHSRDELRELIVDAALDLVQKNGAQAVTARQIAKSIGYTPGMLYAVFTNQLDIFLHVNVRTLDTLHQECAKSCSAETNPSQRLHSLAHTYWAFACQHTHQFDLLFTRQDSTDLAPPAVLPIRVQALFALVEDALLELRPDSEKTSLTLSARALWSGVHGATELGLSELFFIDTSPNPEQTNLLTPTVIDTVVSHFITGWMAKADL